MMCVVQKEFFMEICSDLIEVATLQRYTNPFIIIIIIIKNIDMMCNNTVPCTVPYWSAWVCDCKLQLLYSSAVTGQVHFIAAIANDC